MKMETNKKRKLIEVYPGKEGRESECLFKNPEKRLRFVDFARIEGNRNEADLSSFELEVKKKLACVPSPYDELVRQEEEAEQERKERGLQIKLGLLARKAKLSPQERNCYELLYVEKLAEKEVRKRLGVSGSHLCHLKSSIEQAMREAYLKSQGKEDAKEAL